MKVILQQDVKGKGKKGQMIEASDGYARNFLIPRKLAVPATTDNVNTMRLQEKAKQAQIEREKEEARDIVKKIEAELEYPGQIKVNIIRESRAVDFAK